MINQNTAILDSRINNKEISSGKWPEHNNQICESLHQDHFIEEDGVKFAGHHLIVDFWGASKLDCLKTMEVAMRKAVEKAKATLLHIHLHHFTPNGGISGVAVLAESHISVHTWPEYGFAAFDIFMCGDSKPSKAVEVLEEYFKPSSNNTNNLRRGDVGAKQ